LSKINIILVPRMILCENGSHLMLVHPSVLTAGDLVGPVALSDHRRPNLWSSLYKLRKKLFHFHQSNTSYGY